MAQPYVGQVIAVGFNFAPVGWLSCNGSLQPISQYEVLYTLIGTTYGGDGTTTFGLPDLRGRSPLNAGQKPGRSTYVMGQMSGSEAVSLLSSQVGAHRHGLLASALAGTTAVPSTTTALAQNPQTLVNVYGPGPGSTTLAPSAIGTAGSSLPHENRQPYIAVNYIICYAGIYPPQS